MNISQANQEDQPPAAKWAQVVSWSSCAAAKIVSTETPILREIVRQEFPSIHNEAACAGSIDILGVRAAFLSLEHAVDPARARSTSALKLLVYFYRAC
jgi:hypothetical protein